MPACRAKPADSVPRTRARSITEDRELGVPDDAERARLAARFGTVLRTARGHLSSSSQTQPG